MKATVVALGLVAALSRPTSAAPGSDAPRSSAGRVPPEISMSRDLGPADPDLPFTRVVLLLAPRDPAGRDMFLAGQQDPTCDRFHRWLSPEEFGRRFGATSEDIDRVSAWLSEKRLTVHGPNAGRTVLLSSGRLEDVARAFETEFRSLLWNGEPHVANVTPPTVPRELSTAIRGVLSHDDFQRARPLYTTSAGGHFLAPADLAAIYDFEPLYSSGLDGRGQTIVIPGGSQIAAADTRTFRQNFGLPASEPSVITVGKDPGTVSGNDIEGNLDVQWAGGVARGASIVFVVSEAPLPAVNPDLAVLYSVDHDLGGVLSLSWGWCEADSSPEYIAYYHNLWAQAAAQGISVLVASGDSGILGCAVDGGVHPTAISVSALGSSPYCTSVGGTEFDDLASPASYWNPTNDPVTKRSVKGPIPEVSWTGSGGGLSAVHSRPAWQQVSGLAPGDKRAIPDVSLSASGHDAYLVQRGGLLGVGGTSASTPAFAGLVALLDQRLGGRQGNLNPTLYALGRAQYGGGGQAVFRDVIAGDNSNGATQGYRAGPGYDLVTGLGSVDATALVSAWAAYVPVSGPAAGDFTIAAFPESVPLTAGGSASVSVALATAGGEAVATLSAGRLPPGWTATFSPAKQSDAAIGYLSPSIPALVRIAAPANAASGSYAIVLIANAGSKTRRTAVVVTVGVPDGTAPGVELQAPVVLNVFGSGGSHFTSDFFALNRSAVDATLLLRYVAAPGTPGAGAALVAVPLAAGAQFQTDDVIAFLAANGVTLPTTGGTLGTLYATFAGVSDRSLVAAGSRTSTPNPNGTIGGSFGTFTAAVPSGSGLSGESWIYGLREDGAFRSNLAIVHAPAVSSFGSSAPVIVEIQLYDGVRGVAAGAPIVYTLQPGEFHQFNRILADRGLANGYARVRRTSGADRVIAYGVVNDGAGTGGGTSDGSILLAGASEGLLPIVLDLPGAIHFQTELTLTNPSLTSAATVTLTYTPAASLGASGGGTVSTTLAAGQQLQAASAIALLRSLGLPIPGGGNQGGTLLVSGASAIARTFNPNPDATVGGTFGLAYPALASAARARTSAWVYGLRQDSDTRANLAIADARTSGGNVDYTVEIYDAASGSRQPVETLTRTLGPGQWTQIGLILQGAGVAEGYAHVFPVTGSSDYVTYGVNNDGAGPGSRTSDGSYLGMVVGN